MLSKGYGGKHLSCIFRCSGACFYIIIGWLVVFFCRYKGLKRLQSNDKEEIMLSVHKETHILGGGREKAVTTTVHCLFTLCHVLSLVFLAIHSVSTYCTMNRALGMEQRTGLIVEEKQLQ